MAISRNLSRAFFGEVARKRSRGLRVSKAAVSRATREILEAEASQNTIRGVNTRNLDLQAARDVESSRRFNELQEDRRAEVASREGANTFSGIKEAALLAKEVGVFDSAKTAVATAGTPKAISTASVGVPSVLPEVGAGFGVKTAATSGFGGATGAEGSQAVAGSLTAVPTSTAAPVASPGILPVGATAGAGAGAIAGSVGGFIGQKLTKAGEPGHQGGEVWTGRAIGGALGTVGGFWAGLKTGAAAGSGGGPVGALVGAIIGGILGVFTGGGGSVICSELYKQGYITKDMLELEYQFKEKYIGHFTYQGYRSFADPIVTGMGKSRLFTKLVASIAVPWAYEMASMIDPDRYNSNKFGRFVMKYGIMLCSWKGKRMLKRLAEVQHG